MKFLSRFVVTASAVALVVGQVTAEEADFASVKVVVCDSFGESVPGAQVVLRSIGPKGEFTGVGGEAKFDRIPFGLYDLEVRLPGFLPRKEQIRIYQPALVFQTSLELAPTHLYERAELVGSVSSDVNGRGNLWVRLMALYSSDFVENTVDSSGKFELDGMAVGRYLLILFQKDKVLATRPVDIRGGKQAIDVALDSR